MFAQFVQTDNTSSSIKTAKLIYNFSTFYKLEHAINQQNYDRIILIFDFDFTFGCATENLVYLD